MLMTPAATSIQATGGRGIAGIIEPRCKARALKPEKAMGAAGKTVNAFERHEDTKHGNQTHFLARKAKMQQQHYTHDNVLGIPDDPNC